MAGPQQKKPGKTVPFFASLQVKYAMSYLVIFAVVLVLLNTYPVIASQDLLFTSKRDSLKSQTGGDGLRSHGAGVSLRRPGGEGNEYAGQHGAVPYPGY